MHRAAPLSICLLLAACTAPDPAPQELSELLSFAWTHYAFDPPENEVSLADAGLNLQAWFEANVEALEEYDTEVGYQASLTAESDRLPDDALVGLEPAPQHASGAGAVGVVVVLDTDCTLEDMDRLYTITDQHSLHPDSYVTYDRSEEFGYECFKDGTCDEFGWLSEVTNELILGATSAFSLHNRFRRISAESPGGVQVEGRLGITWMSEEAVLDPETVGRWFQNYQLEYLFEQEDGTVLHVYPQWVEVEVGEIDTEGNLFLNSYIEGLHEYILRVEQHCIDGTGG